MNFSASCPTCHSDVEKGELDPHYLSTCSFPDLEREDKKERKGVDKDEDKGDVDKDPDQLLPSPISIQFHIIILSPISPLLLRIRGRSLKRQIPFTLQDLTI